MKISLIKQYIFMCLMYSYVVADIANIDSMQDIKSDSAIFDDLNTDSTQNKSDDSDMISDIFSPAIVKKNTFGAFAIGYQLLSKSDERLKHGVVFAIERGWNFIDNILLVSLALDGTVGEFYSLNINVNLGTRLFSGRIIPNISLGYGLLNHKISGVQHNLHGTNATIAMFVDIASGFGLQVAYRTSLYPFRTIKTTGTKTNLHSFLLNFKYIDFKI